MWITLLLISHVTSEWVEISQHHYRKPAKVATEYANQTISHVWTDQRRSGEVSGGKKVIPDEDLFVHKDIKSSGKKEFIGVVERVPNVGVIRRVQLPNTPVIETSSAANNLYNNYEVSLENLDESEELPRRVFYSKRKQVHTTEATDRMDIPKTTFRNYSLVKHDESNEFTLNTRITNEGVNNFRTKGKVNKIAKNELITNISPTTQPGLSNFVTTENTVIISENIDKIGQKNKRKSKPVEMKVENNGSSDNFEENKPNYEDPTTEETPTSDTKGNTIEVLMKIMKTVADTISKNSHRSLNSKLRYLHQLKNTILDNIENRIDAIWPDDTDAQTGAKRRSRSAHDAARGHVEFPSSESALMTISFLTFAVFLIKLVLQVIQTYKNKAMMVAPLVVATSGRAALKQLQAHIKQDN